MDEQAPDASGFADWLLSLQTYEPSPGSAGYIMEGGQRLTLSAFLHRVTNKADELEQENKRLRSRLNMQAAIIEGRSAEYIRGLLAPMLGEAEEGDTTDD